jgi:hypothetical protein
VTGKEYLEAITALRGLDAQEARAIEEARVQLAVVAATERLRRGDRVLADGRDRIAAAIAQSKSALQTIGLSALPPGASPQFDPLPAGDVEVSLLALETIALEAGRLSAAQAGAVEEHRRILAAAIRVEGEERQRAAEDEKAAAEFAHRLEQEHRAREAELMRLEDRLHGLQADLAAWAKAWWRFGRRHEMQRLAGEITDIDARIVMQAASVSAIGGPNNE